ncbi:hypothetical protein FGO68_gene757 [Halteria grandinella]|uniref:Uncharacterized protein n=1 Tax=Halteria grandinella TaxID=5974 RepID=A0A8J8NW85_HALGN|nr:hypothetical protein FGO68_gene757 [Halteria grandinella]
MTGIQNSSVDIIRMQNLGGLQTAHMDGGWEGWKGICSQCCCAAVDQVFIDFLPPFRLSCFTPCLIWLAPIMTK